MAYLGHVEDIRLAHKPSSCLCTYIALMEKILNFNEPIDVNLLENLVDAIYGPDPRAVC